MKKRYCTAGLLLSAIILGAGCGSQDSTLEAIPVDSDATIPENGSLMDSVYVGMSGSDAKKALDDNKVDYEESDGMYASTAITKFVSCDSSFEIYTEEDTVYQAEYDLYFPDENSYASAKDKLNGYFTGMMAGDTGLDMLADGSGTLYYPVEKIDVDGEGVIHYISLSEVEYYETPGGSYIESGYEITEEYVAYSDWSSIAESESEEEEE